MSQDVDAGAIPAKPPIGGVKGFLNDTSADRLAEGSDMAHEDRATRGLRPLVHEVVRYGRAGCSRQRQHVGPSRFTGGDRDCSGLPVNVVEAQLDDLAASQAQVCQAADDGIAAAARRTRSIERSEELLQLVGRKPYRQRDISPICRARYGP